MIDYEQNDAVRRIHNVPRFGHTNQLSSLSTGLTEDKDDYIRGITAFTIFCFCLIIVWSSILLLLKFYFTSEKVGCAARGEPVDPSELRAQGVSRRERRKRIQRAWRVQICFLSLSMMIPGFTCLLVNHGYRPFLASLGEIIQVNDDFEARVFRGVQIASSLTNLAHDLRTNELLDTSIFQVDNLCPNFENSTQVVKSLGLDTLHDDVSSGIEEADNFLKENISDVKNGLSQATWATKSVDKVIQQVLANDWYLKLLLVLLNVFNILLWIGAFLTKIGVQFEGYQLMVTWIVLPLFGMLLVATVSATGLLLSLALVNADFCAGGPSPGSPQATLRNIVRAQGYSSDSILAESLEYYLGGCASSNPYGFIADIQVDVRDAGLSVTQLTGAFREFDIAEISAECGRDLSPFLFMLEELGEVLVSTAGYLRATSSVADCGEITEILDEVFNGAVCNETIEGLSWMFGGLLTITFIVMMMFSTRAGLFNTVYKPKRRRRREREFDEYRDFMGQFYEDAGRWKMDPEKKTMLRIESADTDEISNFASASTESPEPNQHPTIQTDFDQNSTFHTVSHQKFTEQIVMTPLTKAAVAAGAKAAALAAERALLENTSLQESGAQLDESYDSSSSEESDEPSIISNISTIVDRFFSGRGRQREQTDISISSYAPSTADSQDVPPSDYAADPSFDLLGAMDRSFDSGSALDCYIEDNTLADEPPTPLVDRAFAPRPNAPHKTVKTLGRTKGGSFLDDE